MLSLELIEFWECAGITDAGLAALSKLPRLNQFTITAQCFSEWDIRLSLAGPGGVFELKGSGGGLTGV